MCIPVAGALTRQTRTPKHTADLLVGKEREKLWRLLKVGSENQTKISWKQQNRQFQNAVGDNVFSSKQKYRQHCYLQESLDVFLLAAIQLGDSVFQPLLHHSPALCGVAQQLWVLGLLRQVTGDGHQSHQWRTVILLQHRRLNQEGERKGDSSLNIGV